MSYAPKHYRVEFENGNRVVVIAESAMIARMTATRGKIGPTERVVKVTKLRMVPAYGYPSGWRYDPD